MIEMRFHLFEDWFALLEIPAEAAKAGFDRPIRGVVYTDPEWPTQEGPHPVIASVREHKGRLQFTLRLLTVTFGGAELSEYVTPVDAFFPIVVSTTRQAIAAANV